MIVSKETIEREAREAAQQGKTIDEACRWPFGSPEADHWKAAYLLVPGNKAERGAALAELSRVNREIGQEL